MIGISRRNFLRAGAGVALGGMLDLNLFAQTPIGDRPEQDPAVTVLYPRDRVPLTFIIDDSTCLVNMGHFCIPQFQSCYPDRPVYQKPWWTFPREIPDSFVREFGEWCAENGVKGKYSIVPYPSCVGWLDRELPGWSRKDLLASLKLVRDLMVPNWDIHPEMITHTRVIDLKTGRPFDEISPATMENSYPREKKSVDELAAYLAYALQIIKNCDLPCEGVTTPGGFGNLVKSELSLAAQEAVRDVYNVEIPHYFKYVITGDESTEPIVENVSGLGTSQVNLTVNIPAGTGDWYGSWEGDVTPEPDRYATEDASSGRMVELIEKGQPAFMLCHWPGMYCNGSKIGFQGFQRNVLSLNSKYGDRTHWMKLSEIARYWAAKELTTVQVTDSAIHLNAPFACPDFTLRTTASHSQPPQLIHKQDRRALTEVKNRSELTPGTWHHQDNETTVCFALPKGKSQLKIDG
ncbi:twin-arginine translocation signal domain-containing protein [Thalassoglobus sp. JC818]|uniref:twin-arginine translocation signal domain-containing protein n=1 Tax=Thalassoglobus sp. JC818 TaxID=3232136 RepID=UPI003459C96F